VVVPSEGGARVAASGAQAWAKVAGWLEAHHVAVVAV